LLTAEEIGTYNLCYQIVLFLYLFIIFGTVHTTQKYVPLFDARGENRKTAGFVHFIAFFTSIFAFSLFGIVLVFKGQLSLFFFSNLQHEKYVMYVAILLLFGPSEVISQFFISRYEFKRFFLPNTITDIFGLVLKVLMLVFLRSIDAYFLTFIITEAMRFTILVIAMLTTFKNPDYSFSKQEIIKYMLPMFVGNILTFLELQVANFLFYFLFRDLELFGVLSFINFVVQLVLNIFNSWHTVLVSWYAPIIHGENNKERYYEITKKISKIFQFLTVNIGLIFMLVGPLYILVIVRLFEIDQLYLQGAFCLLAYGIQFMLTMFYYMSPTVINLEEKSFPILMIHVKASVLYLSAYFVLIPLLGLAGIPLGYALGNVYFYILCKRLIKKHSFRVGFAKESCKKILVAVVPAIVIIMIAFVCDIIFSQTSPLNLVFFEIQFPFTAFCITMALGLVMILAIVLILKRLRFFTSDDKEMLSQLLGKRIFKYVAKIIF